MKADVCDSTDLIVGKSASLPAPNRWGISGVHKLESENHRTSMKIIFLFEFPHFLGEKNILKRILKQLS